MSNCAVDQQKLEIDLKFPDMVARACEDAHDRQPREEVANCNNSGQNFNRTILRKYNFDLINSALIPGRGSHVALIPVPRQLLNEVLSLV